MADQERILAELCSDALTHTSAPSSRAQADVEEQRPPKLQESVNEMSYMIG